MLLQPVPGFESDCSVTVRFDDGTVGTVSAAEQPKPILEEVAPLLVYGALQGALTFLGDGDGARERAEECHEELLEELAAAAARGSGGAAPLSGVYWGSSEESDEGDQAVRTTLTFGSDGTIEGRGRDGVDGNYRISRGRWGVLDGDSEPTVAWIEKYDEGFEVMVQGKCDARSGKIEARFTSSRGVRGAFGLAPKPSVF